MYSGKLRMFGQKNNDPNKYKQNLPYRPTWKVLYHISLKKSESSGSMSFLSMSRFYHHLGSPAKPAFLKWKSPFAGSSNVLYNVPTARCVVAGRSSFYQYFVPDGTMYPAVTNMLSGLLFYFRKDMLSDREKMFQLSIWQNLIYIILNAKTQRHKGTKILNFASFRLCDLAFKI